MEAKKPYIEPTLEKRETLVEVAEGERPVISAPIN